jgi:hypothetical protein
VEILFPSLKNNEGDEPNWSTIYVDMELSQRKRTPLNNYYILIKKFRKGILNEGWQSDSSGRVPV